MPILPWLEPDDPFPPLSEALADPNGLLAAGADLSLSRLLSAYAQGIFPWSNDDEPLLWWSPDPRMVLWTDRMRITRSLRQRLRSRTFTVTLDTAFADVIRGCADRRRDAEGTWISSQFQEAYTRLHRAGYAHSVEAWRDGHLVGGLYGVAIGRAFFGESMFARDSDASKVALAHLVRQLERWGFPLIDCQMATAHLASLGGSEIPRDQFMAHVRRLITNAGPPSPWRLDPAIADSF